MSSLGEEHTLQSSGQDGFGPFRTLDRLNRVPYLRNIQVYFILFFIRRAARDDGSNSSSKTKMSSRRGRSKPSTRGVVPS
jgi:hypothetical protein